MAPKESPESLAEAFASAPREKGCGTCKLARIEEINRAVDKFAELKKDGSTTQPWSDFLKYVLRPCYGYHLSVHTLRRHVRECLGHE